MSSRSLAPEVFKAYDIRGIVPGQIDAAFARRLGLALASTRGGRAVAVLRVKPTYSHSGGGPKRATILASSSRRVSR